MNANTTLAVSNNELIDLAVEYDLLVADLDAGRTVDEARMANLTEVIDGAPQLRNKPVGVAEWLDVATADVEAGEDPITLEQYLRQVLGL